MKVIISCSPSVHWQTIQCVIKVKTILHDLDGVKKLNKIYTLSRYESVFIYFLNWGFCCLLLLMRFYTSLHFKIYILLSDLFFSVSLHHFRSNININDVLGNYSLTLIDTLDTLLVSNPELMCICLLSYLGKELSKQILCKIHYILPPG